MKCEICGRTSHSAPNCPNKPEHIGRKAFSREEKESAESNVRKVAAEFLDKARKLAGKVPFIPDAAAMYYCMLDVKTPFWVKANVAAALAYFISPVDIVPDWIPVVGYADDAAVIAMTMAIIHHHITDEHAAKARSLFE